MSSARFRQSPLSLQLLAQRIQNVGHAIRFYVHERGLLHSRKWTLDQTAMIFAQIRPFLKRWTRSPEFRGQTTAVK
jgi:hypothetical protein